MEYSHARRNAIVCRRWAFLAHSSLFASTVTRLALSANCHPPALLNPAKLFLHRFRRVTDLTIDAAPPHHHYDVLLQRAFLVALRTRIGGVPRLDDDPFTEDALLSSGGGAAAAIAAAVSMTTTARPLLESAEDNEEDERGRNDSDGSGDGGKSGGTMGAFGARLSRLALTRHHMGLCHDLFSLAAPHLPCLTELDVSGMNYVSFRDLRPCAAQLRVLRCEDMGSWIDMEQLLHHRPRVPIDPVAMAWPRLERLHANGCHVLHEDVVKSIAQTASARLVVLEIAHCGFDKLERHLSALNSCIALLEVDWPLLTQLSMGPWSQPSATFITVMPVKCPSLQVFDADGVCPSTGALRTMKSSCPLLRSVSCDSPSSRDLSAADRQQWYEALAALRRHK
jgi:hypothetical protein